MNNPYLAPGAILTSAPSELASHTPKILSWKGRLGRLRYLTYLFGLSMLLLPVLAILMTVLGPRMTAGESLNQPLIWGLGILFYVPMLVCTAALAKRRFNDTNRSGWLALLLIVPLVNLPVSLYLMFAAGTDGANDYGLPASPNTRWIKVGGVVLPLLCTVGGVAASSIPLYQAAYQSYEKIMTGESDSDS
ncbi:MAG: DUF805 domain-containing protein [Pseudomonadota bacterium]